MRRTRRATAPASDANEEATPGTAEATPDSLTAAASETIPDESSAATKPKARPRRRTVKADSAIQTELPIAADEVAHDTAADEPVVAEVKAVKQRSRGRRKPEATVSAEPATSGSLMAETYEASAPIPEDVPLDTASSTADSPVTTASSDDADSSTPSRSRRRRRGRRTGAAETISATSAEPGDVEPEDSEPKSETATEEPAIPTRARRSRRRGKPVATHESAENVLIPGLSEIATPVSSDESADETDVAPVRRGRSRRRKPIADVAAPVAGAEVVTPAASDAAEEGEDSRRGKRSRRGGRRRRGEETIDIADPSTLIVGGELGGESEDEEEIEEDVLLPYPPPAPPVYVAPPLVRPVVRSEDAPLPSVAASIERDPNTGYPRIVINAQTHSPSLFFINAEEAVDGEVVESQIRHAATQGVHLYSSVMYLPLRNAYGERTFGPIDAVIQQVLAGDPEAYIIPRLQFVPTNYWVRTHHDQLARYSDGSEGDVSLASVDFWSDCIDALEALIVHLSDPNTPGGERVVGFHLDRGEWFNDASVGYDLSGPNQAAFQNWLQAKYQFIYQLRSAWYDGSVSFETASIPAWQGAASAGKKGDTPIYATQREGRWVDYSFFSSDLVAQVITGLASAVKELSAGRMLAAVSYGYTLEFAARNNSGHLAMRRVLESPDIDIVASPSTYTGRGAGSAGAFSALIDSIRLHNKVWLLEDDTKTHLSDTETPDSYNPRIGSPSDTLAVHQRNFGAALTRKAGIAWMDLWGQGWLNDPDIWHALGQMRGMSERWHDVCERPAQSHDVIAIVDEASLSYLRNDVAGLGAQLIGKARELLLRTGASVGFYLQSDVVHDNFPDAPLYLFLNSLRITTAERQAIREKLQRQGKTLAWLYAPGLFDEDGPARQEIGEVVGMTLRLQPWNARAGSQLTDTRHPLTERVRSGKRIGQEEILNPSFSVSDPQATVLGEYVSTGAPSIAVREHSSGWRSVFYGDPHITVELLRGLLSYAGVPVYNSQDDIVLAGNDGSLLLHAPYTGQRTVHLPYRATVYDTAEDKIVCVDNRSFRTFMRARTSRLFLFGPSDEMASATGLEIMAAPPPQAARSGRSMDRSDSDQNDEFGSDEARQTPGRSRGNDGGRPSGYEQDDEYAGDEDRSSEASGEDIPTPVRHTDRRLIPGLDADTGSDPEDGDTAAQSLDEMTAPQPKSRWQRRRAAARARRDAERRAKSNPSPDDAGAPIDIASLLPDLPPRLPRPESSGNADAE